MLRDKIAVFCQLHDGFHLKLMRIVLFLNCLWAFRLAIQGIKHSAMLPLVRFTQTFSRFFTNYFPALCIRHFFCVFLPNGVILEKYFYLHATGCTLCMGLWHQ